MVAYTFSFSESVIWFAIYLVTLCLAAYKDNIYSIWITENNNLNSKLKRLSKDSFVKSVLYLKKYLIFYTAIRQFIFDRLKAKIGSLYFQAKSEQIFRPNHQQRLAPLMTLGANR